MLTPVIAKEKTKSFRNCKLTSFPNLSKYLHCTLLSFDGNPLENFKGLPPLQDLKDLYLDNTKISSFLGAPELPSLERISLKMSPLGYYKKLDLMCSVVFGSQLQFVNGEEVKQDRIKFSNQNRDLLLPYFRDGWVLTSKSPLRFIHYKTRARMCVKIQQSPSKTMKKEDQIENSEEKTMSINDTDNGFGVEIDENHSEHTVYEEVNETERNKEGNDKSTNVDTETKRVVDTMKTLSDNWTKDLKKKDINNENYAENQVKRANNKNKDPPTGMRSIVRRPGGVADPFTMTPQLVFQEKPIPQVNSPLRPKVTIRINAKKTASSNQQNLSSIDNDSFGHDSFSYDDPPSNY